MSTARNKDQQDYDLEQIVRVIDTALESDDQRIKDALRALLTITVLCTAQHPDQAIKGPLSRLMEDIRDINRRIGRIDDELQQVKWDQQRNKQVDPFTPPYQPPTAPYGPIGSPSNPWTGTPTGPKPMWGPSWSSSDIGSLPDVKKWSAGDDPNYRGSSASTTLAEDFLKKLGEIQ